VRFLVEFLRRNQPWLLGMTTAQAFSIASVAIGVWLLRRTQATPAASSVPAEPG